MRRAFPKRSGSLLLPVLAALVLTGCGKTSFVGKRVDNFTAYYNTFYNAQKSFDDGVNAFGRNDQPIDRGRYISIYQLPPRSINVANFEAAISKSADVLREHPGSKWVDDALLLIGKSYFFQQNYVGAEQKFREVINIGTELEDEAHLWLARTLTAAGSLNSAREHLVSSLARENLSKRWEPKLRLALAELYVKERAFAEAEEELEKSVADVREKDLRARSWFLLGQIRERLGDYKEAVAAYERVPSAKPRYELAYAAQTSAVRVEGRYLDADAALRKLRRMERDDKNYSNRFELAYLRGHIYQSDGRPNDALDLYREVLYDADGNIGNVRGRIHYALGELFRDRFEDFLVAAAHFDTARTALQSNAGRGTSNDRSDELFAPEAITDAQEQARMFGSFASVRGDVARLDSLLELGELDDETFAAKIMEMRHELARQMDEDQRRAERMRAERGFQNAAAQGSQATRGRDVAGQNAETETAGFLYHRDPVRVQEGRLNFITRWGERPLAPNWRRMDAIRGSQQAADPSGEQPDVQLAAAEAEGGAEALPLIDFSDVPRDSLSRAAMLAERAVGRYELGNVLFLGMNRPDSAAAWYRMVIEEDADQEVAQRAFYALAEVHQSLGDDSAARRLYQQVLEDYPHSDFAGRVLERLGLDTPVAASDAAAVADAYDSAFLRWQRGAYGSAFERMIRTAVDFPDSDYAARALLAAGTIFMEWAEKDSLDVLGPLPVTLPDSVLFESGLFAAASPRRSQSDEPEDPEGEDGPQPEISPTDEPENGGDAPRKRNTQAQTGTPAGSNGQIAPTDNGPTDDPVDARDSSASRLNPEEWVVDEEGGPFAADSDSSLSVPDSKSAELVDETIAVTDSTAPNPDADAPSETVVTPDSVAVESEGALDQGADDSGGALNPEADDSGGTLNPEADDFGDALDPEADDSGIALNQEADSSEEAVNQEADASDEPEEYAVYLETLYTSVKRNFAGSKYADQADRMLKALDTHLAERTAEADSIQAAQAKTQEPSDSLVADLAAFDSLTAPSDSNGFASDTLAAGDAPNTADTDTSGAALTRDESVAAEAAPTQGEAATEAADAQAEAATDTAAARAAAAAADRGAAREEPDSGQVDSAIPRGEEAMMGEGGVDRGLGGFTLMLGSSSDPQPMLELVEKYRKMGLRADVLADKEGNAEVYRAVVGHFASQREAGMALVEYSGQIEKGARPIRVETYR